METAAARLHWAPAGNTSKVSAFPSAWLTLLCVIVFGVLGGLISAIPVLARPPAAPDPYGLAVYQGTLKLPLGGVFAVIGCLALQSGTLPGVTGVTSLEGLLFWAAAFGASQQAATSYWTPESGTCSHLQAKLPSLILQAHRSTGPRRARIPDRRTLPADIRARSRHRCRADHSRG